MDTSLNLGQPQIYQKKEEKPAKEHLASEKTNTPSGVFNAVPNVETAGTIASAPATETAGTIASNSSSSSSGGSFSSLA